MRVLERQRSTGIWDSDENLRRATAAMEDYWRKKRCVENAAFSYRHSLLKWIRPIQCNAHTTRRSDTMSKPLHNPRDLRQSFSGLDLNESPVTFEVREETNLEFLVGTRRT